MESVVELTSVDAGEVLTLQRAAYLTEAQLHDDLHLPPLTQSLAELMIELNEVDTLGLGLRDASGRLMAAVRVKFTPGGADLGLLTVAPDLQGPGLGRHCSSSSSSACRKMYESCGCSPVSTALEICGCMRDSDTPKPAAP